MTASGEAKGANSIGVNVPLVGLMSNEANRALDILHWLPVNVVWDAARHAVFQDKRGHTDRVKPLGNFEAFFGPSQNVVAAARADHDGAPIRFVFRGRVGRQCCAVDKSDSFFGGLRF